MDNKIKDIIKTLGVKVVYEDSLDCNGYYISLVNIIVINNSLSNLEKKKALLHELGHACKHKDDYILYRKTTALKSKMESEADIYMVDYIIEENEGIFNYSQLIEEFGLGMGLETRFAK